MGNHPSSTIMADIISYLLSKFYPAPKPQEPLRTQVSVDVTAPKPDQTKPWPKPDQYYPGSPGTDEILLGTRDKPPLGFYTPPGEQTPGSMSKSVVGPWSEVSRVAPQFASRAPKQTNLEGGAITRAILGLGAYSPALDHTFYSERPSPELVAHETTHRMQTGNFLDRAAAEKAWNPPGEGELAYLDRPGEQQAFKVEELLAKRRGKR